MDGGRWPPAPPAYGHPDAGGERPPFVLIDPRAYFADRRNSTTAVCDLEGPDLKGQLQVTFCAVAPPRVSYLCVHATRMDHTDFAVASYILATKTDGGLVLLCVSATSDGEHPTDDLLPRNRQYFFYDALTRALYHLPRPGPQHEINENSLAIMRKRTGDYSRFILRPHGHGHGHGHGEAEAEADHFVVAAQAYMFWGEKSPHLCIYDSATNTWSNKPVVMDSYPDSEQHFTTKTLVGGGRYGTVAWVDLWRNIVFCDVLAELPELSCLKLPCRPAVGDGNPRLLRDIAVCGDTIKYVEVLPHADTSSSKTPSRRWVVAAWSIEKARRSWPKDWRMVCKLDSTHIKVDAAGTMASFPTLSSLHVGLPTLSLQNDAIVYFLAKIDFSPSQHTAWVLAVDMKNETAKQVVEFPVERTFCLSKGYDASRISTYLQPAPVGDGSFISHTSIVWGLGWIIHRIGTQQIPKRPRVRLLKYPSMKHIKDVEDPEEDDVMLIVSS